MMTMITKQNSFETAGKKALGLWAATMVSLALITSAQAMEIQDIESPRGINAWLVEDYTLPIVTLSFAFEGGSAQDLKGKEGAASLLTYLMDEGAGDLDSQSFQKRLQDTTAQMSFSANTETITGTMRVLVDEKDDAFKLLALAINEPRFDEVPFNRIRKISVSRKKASANNPETIAAKASGKFLFGDHPYGKSGSGTIESLSSLSVADIKERYEALFARSNLKVAIVGAIDPREAAQLVDELFADLPQDAKLTEIVEVQPELGRKHHEVLDMAQTQISLTYPGLDRHDPDFYTAYTMNHILGGGIFTSRLFDEVREKRGLAYGVNSYLSSPDKSHSLNISTSTGPQNTPEVLQVIKDVVAKLANEGVTQQELDEARRFIISSYAISRLNNSTNIANALVNYQLDDLGRDYIQNREDYFNAVKLDDVNAMAKKLLSPEPTIFLAGPKVEEMK